MAKRKLASPQWPADKVERRPVADLIPYARNARTHSDAQVAQIAASIREWGWTVPVLIAEDSTIIAGHGRVLAAQKLGMADVPCMVATGWTEAQRRAYVIADNKLTLNGGWDDGLLATEMADLLALDFDMDLTGFSSEEIAALTIDKTVGLTDPDDAPEPPVNPVSEPGDTWLLGKHRIRCGDSTSADDVAALLNGVEPHLMVTDPPYGIGYEYRTHDDQSAVGNAELVGSAFAFGPSSKVYTPGLMNLRRELDRYPMAKVAVWDKGFAAAGNGLGGASTWEPVIIESPMCKALRNDVLRVNTDRATIGGVSLRKMHSCPKPVALYRELVSAFSRVGDIIYEPFGGSGTTVLACEMEGRHSFAMEIDAAYTDVIVKRWQEFTGQTATLEGDGRTFDEISQERYKRDWATDARGSYDAGIEAKRAVLEAG